MEKTLSQLFLEYKYKLEINGIEVICLRRILGIMLSTHGLQQNTRDVFSNIKYSLDTIVLNNHLEDPPECFDIF